MRTVTVRPTARETVAALRTIARLLGLDCAYARGGAFYFDLGGGWALGLFPDDAGRFRITALYGSTEVGRLWARSGDWGRLADLALGLRREIEALDAQRG